MTARNYLVGVVFLLSLISIVDAVFSQESTTPLERGGTLEVRQNATVRAKPPEQTWWLFVTKPGDAVGKLNPGEKVKIEGIKTVKVPSGEDTWVKVKKEGNAAGSSESGWVFYGRGLKSENFAIQK